jgi:hypothetical protein
MDLLSISDIARRLGVRPRAVSDLFYQRVLRDDLCPVVGGRRLVPADYLAEVKKALTERGGRLQGSQEAQP